MDRNLCWSCGYSGDVITLVMWLDRCSVCGLRPTVCTFAVSASDRVVPEAVMARGVRKSTVVLVPCSESLMTTPVSDSGRTDRCLPRSAGQRIRSAGRVIVRVVICPLVHTAPRSGVVLWQSSAERVLNTAAAPAPSGSETQRRLFRPSSPARPACTKSGLRRRSSHSYFLTPPPLGCSSPPLRRLACDRWCSPECGCVIDPGRVRTDRNRRLPNIR